MKYMILILVVVLMATFANSAVAASQGCGCQEVKDGDYDVTGTSAGKLSADSLDPDISLVFADPLASKKSYWKWNAEDHQYDRVDKDGNLHPLGETLEFDGDGNGGYDWTHKGTLGGIIGAGNLSPQ